MRLNKIYNPSKRKQEVSSSVFISLFYNPYFVRINFNEGMILGEKIYCPKLTQSEINSKMKNVVKEIEKSLKILV